MTQMLHPMHSRMSSKRPASILAGRNGSAIEGRAAPIRSSTPSRIMRTIVSGDVKRPTPTTGFVVSCFSPFTYSSCAPSPAKREVIESKSHSPTMKSHRSGQLADEAEHLLDLRALEAGSADELVDADPAGHRRPPVDLLERLLQDLPQQPRPVLEAAAVVVRPVVRAAREEMLDRRQPVPGVHVDEVVPGAERPRDGLPVPAAQVGDVLHAHAPRLHRIGAGRGQVRGAERRAASPEIGGVHAAVDELDPGERPVLVHLRYEQLVRGDVRVVPDPSLHVRADVGCVVDLHLLRAHDRPATLCLDPAHDRVRGRIAVSHAVAVRAPGRSGSGPSPARSAPVRRGRRSESRA